MTSKSANFGIGETYAPKGILKGMGGGGIVTFGYLGISKVRNLGCGGDG